MNINISKVFECGNSDIKCKEFSDPWVSYNPRFDIIQALANFNSSINCVTDPNIVLNKDAVQAFAMSNDTINFTIDSVKKLRDTVISNIEKTIMYFQKTYDASKDFYPNYSFFQKQQMLKNALFSIPHEELETRIPDINMSKELVQSSTLDNVLLCDETLFDEFNKAIQFPNALTHEDEVKAVLDRFKNIMSRLLLPITLKHEEFSKHDIYDSITKISEKIYGELEYDDEYITDELFSRAYDNIDNIPKLVSVLFEMKSICFSCYNTLIQYLTDILNKISICAADDSKIESDEYAAKYSFMPYCKTTAIIVCYGISTIKRLLNIHTFLLAYKINRMYSIICASNRVLTKSYDIIRSSSDISIPAEDEEIEEVSIKESFMNKWAVNNDLDFSINEETICIDAGASEFVQELNEIYYEFLNKTAILNEEYDSFKNDQNLHILLEAKNNKARLTPKEVLKSPSYTGFKDKQNNSTNSNSENKSEEKTTDTSSSINSDDESLKRTFTFVDGILERFLLFWDKIQQKIQELFQINARKFWNKKFSSGLTGKERVIKLRGAIENIKVKDWYCYNLDLLKRSDILLKFDVTKDYLQSTEAFQQMLLNNLKNGATFKENSSFTEKIKQLFQGEYIENEDNKAKKLSDCKYNHDAAVNFVNGIMTKQFNSDTCGNIGASRDTIVSFVKGLKSNYKSYLNAIKSSPKTTNKESADIIIPKPTDDFKFNLAKHFGIMHETEVKITAQDASELEKAGVVQNDKSNEEELGKLVRIYIDNSKDVVAVKLECVQSAFKQYMKTWASILDKATKEAKKSATEEKSAKAPAQPSNQPTPQPAS